jgi:hypothetical protein
MESSFGLLFFVAETSFDVDSGFEIELEVELCFSFLFPMLELEDAPVSDVAVDTGDDPAIDFKSLLPSPFAGAEIPSVVSDGS